jgi:DNA uptake protein ComE-like DNA-binding protein
MKRKKINTGWLEYFNYSSRERRGALFLSVLIVIQIIVLIIIRNIDKEKLIPDEKIVQAILSSKIEVADSNIISDSLNVNSFIPSFDPNQIADTTKEFSFLSSKQLSVIRNYLNHGGKFRSKKDFKKMYCISENEYEKMESSIQLPDSLEFKKYENKKSFAEKKVIDIGIADSSELLAVRGIGPAFASRIVRFREKLGGFYSINQLKEVWGITDSVFQNLIPNFILKDTIPFRLIHLNTDSFNVLGSHPYLKGKIAGIICRYRKAASFCFLSKN